MLYTQCIKMLLETIVTYTIVYSKFLATVNEKLGILKHYIPK